MTQIVIKDFYKKNYILELVLIYWVGSRMPDFDNGSSIKYPGEEEITYLIIYSNTRLRILQMDTNQ